ncbi:MAG TPA: NADH-quinone oxidoreductase subunit N [Peptococcaceae bacterium]|nr:NADH-quinone oxidoreductase subunit N [Peptococcaceae bacterium]
MNIDFSLLITEISLAILGLTVFTLGLILPAKSSQKGLGTFSLCGLLVILALTIASWGNQGETLGGMYLADYFTSFFKILSLTALILVILGSKNYVNSQIENHLEYYSTLIFATLGMIIMFSAGDFITLYLGLELMTISFIVLTSFRRTNGKSLEAGMKYLLLAGLSSAVLLYGLSLVYGAAGTVFIKEIAGNIAQGYFNPLLIVGLAMLIAGFGFKISAAPFHMWAPDVYEGAPTPVTAFLAVGSKAASFAVLIRVFLGAFLEMQEQWTMLIAFLAALSMLIGNLTAFAQTNIKRMLAFSSIAQAGYILVGLVAANEAGIKGVMFYSFIYVFATIGAFTVVSEVYNKTGSDDIADYAGLSQRAPLAAVVLLISMLSMAGIPPLAGFTGKYYLFITVVQDYLWLVYLGLILSMVSVYYYLRVVLVMFRDEPADPAPLKLGSTASLTLWLTLAATLFLGIYPWPLAKLANTVAIAFLAGL